MIFLPVDPLTLDEVSEGACDPFIQDAREFLSSEGVTFQEFREHLVTALDYLEDLTDQIKQEL